MGRTRTFDEGALFSAATELFWTQGYDATSLSQLADNAGIGNGSIYSAYGSKLGLFSTVFDRYCACRVDVVREAMDSDPLSARGAVENFFATIIADCASQPSRRGCLMLNSLSELGIREPEVRATCDRTTASMEHLVAARLAEGSRVGQLAATAEQCEVLGAQVVLVSQGLIQMSRLDTPESKLVSVAATSVTMLPWAARADAENISATAERIARAVARIRAAIAAASAQPGRQAPQPLSGVTLSQSLVDTVRSAAALRLVADARSVTTHGGLTADIEAYIDENLHNPALSPGGIALAHHISVRSLHLLFEGRADTVSRLIHKRRLDRARAELEASAGSSIAGISARWGFGSPSHFTRAFKQHFGVSPSALQKLRRHA